MPNKRISQLPLGVLTPNSIFAIVASGVTSQINFSQILSQVNADDTFITGATYNPSNGTTTFNLNNGNTFDVTGYFTGDTYVTGGTYDNGTTTFTNTTGGTFDVTGFFTGYTYTPEDSANKQNNMAVDGFGIKFPTVDAVNLLTNDIARAVINTGFLDVNDDFTLYKFDDNTLGISGSSLGIAFSELFKVQPFAPSSAIVQLSSRLVPLSDIGITGGSTVKFVGYRQSDDSIIFSDTMFIQSPTVCQLGVVLVKYSAGTTSFIDEDRTFINQPDIAAYNNLETTGFGLESSVIVSHNANDLTIKNTGGVLIGISVNWHGLNNDLLPITISEPTGTTFTYLYSGASLSPTPIPFVSNIDPTLYWDGSALVNLPTISAATVQRFLVNIRGGINVQYSEFVYPNFQDAVNNASVQTFSDVLPTGTFAEVGRLIVTSGTTDLSDTSQAIFLSTNGGGGSSTVSPTIVAWGNISGSITDQTDLQLQFATKQPLLISSSTININSVTANSITTNSITTNSITATTFIKSGGTSSQFLMADGSTTITPITNFIDLGTATTATTNVNLSNAINFKVYITGDTTLNFIPQLSGDGKANNITISLKPAITPIINYVNNNSTDINTLIWDRNNMIIVDNLSLTKDEKFTANVTTGPSTGYIYGMGFQSNGDIIICGDVNTYNGNNANYAARLSKDGAFKNSLNPQTPNPQAFCLKILPNDKMFFGGSFVIFNGVNRNGITKLNADGTNDTSFIIGTGFNPSTILVIDVQSGDSKVLVGGGFSQYSGVSSNRLIRLNPDGSYDNTFNIGTGFNNTVQTLLIQPDGKIICGGQFTTYSGQSSNRIIRLNPDGSKDNNFNIFDGFDNTVNAVRLTSTGKVLVGGTFISYGGYQTKYGIILKNTGVVDQTNFVGSGFNGNVYCSLVQPDSKIVVGGQSFTTYNGAVANRITRINTDGTPDLTFSAGTGFNSIVYKVGIQSDNKIVVGGDYTQYSGFAINRIIRLNANGTRDTTFSAGTGFDNIVFALKIQSDNKSIVGGFFTAYSGVAVNRIVRLNTNGTIDPTFNIGTGFNQFVGAIEIPTGDTKIIVGGAFTTYSGITANNIIRLNSDGSVDNTYNVGTGFSGQIAAFKLQPDNKLIVGGVFSSFNSVSSNKIARLNPDGTLDNTFNIGTGFNGSQVYGLGLQSDGKILVGGDFTQYNGISVNKFAILNPDGTLDTTFSAGTGFNNSVRTMEALPNNFLFMGGDFTNFKTTTLGDFVQLNSDGSIDNTFTMGVGFNNSVSTMEIQSGDSKILVGGAFTTYSGVSSNRLIRLNSNGTIDSSFNVGVGFANTVQTILIESADKFLVSGNFTTYQGITTNRFAKLYFPRDKTYLFNIIQRDNNLFFK